MVLDQLRNYFVVNSEIKEAETFDFNAIRVLGLFSGKSLFLPAKDKNFPF
jgi:hypothetical protein